MRNFVRVLGPAALALTIAGCQSVAYGPPIMADPAPRQPARTAIEGEWIDPNGIISSFRNGAFETRTTDSGSLLAEGSYRYESDRLVAIELRSLVRDTTSSVNCSLVTPSQLNCTSSAGQQFTLVRRA